MTTRMCPDVLSTTSKTGVRGGGDGRAKGGTVTDIELLATAVMGWKVRTSNKDGWGGHNPPLKFVDFPSHQMIIGGNGWNPGTNIADAMQVAQKIGGLALRQGGATRVWYADFYGGDYSSGVQAKTPAAAIFKAAVSWVRENRREA